jgi:hypothetical protein
MRPKHALTFALVGALLAGASGCRAQRELVINSDPPGARIRLDDVLLAEKTPAHIPFKDYGVRRVTLYLDGYVTYSEAVEVKPPWYGYFPLDFVSEILIPVGWRDRHRLRVKLEPGDTRVESPDLVKVMQRAEELRHVGPNGPKLEAKQARTLPRETPEAPESAPPAQKPNPDSKPVNPPAGGGG